MISRRHTYLVWLLIVALHFACVRRPVRELVPPSQIDQIPSTNVYLKAHMRNGYVYIFDSWTVDSDTRSVAGNAELLNINRESLGQHHYSVYIDSVAIFETNKVVPSPSIASMALITGVSLAVTIGCATNPKACFGSCPTFYVRDIDGSKLEAEGFSASIAPSLEARDVDALFRAKPQDGILEVTMRNEALETHIVRAVNLLLVPRREQQRVFLETDESVENGCVFWQTRGLVAPTYAIGEEGDCTTALMDLDGISRTSLADSTDLATKESVDLIFEHVPKGDLGLIIAYRQTLLTTFLFYQTLAYMGASAGSWLASLEKAGPAIMDQIGGIGEVLGGIGVYVSEADGSWRLTNEIRETGPLATNIEVVPLDTRGSGPVNIRLEMTRGAWRVDMVGLTQLEALAQAQRLHPVAVLHDDSPNDIAHRALLQHDQTLITLPGDDYTFVFQLPQGEDSFELFLESKGYYIEWIRNEWLHEENPSATAMMLFNPKKAVVEMAPKYKQHEPQMEEYFWSSRYARP